MKTNLIIFLQKFAATNVLSTFIVMALLLLTMLATQVQAQETIKIGFPMILSGAGAQFGAPILKGAQMMVDDINANGGVLGKKLVLLARDTKAQPELAAEVARKLIMNDHVDFLMGSFTSAEGLTVSAVAKELKTVFLALAPKSDRLTAPAVLHPYIFRLSANTTTESRTAASIVARWKVKRIATIAPDFAYGRDSVEVFIAQIKKIRPDIEIVDQQWPKLTETNFLPFILAQKNSKPDAVFSAICCGHFDAFARQAKPIGYFDALNGHFMGVAETGAIEYTRSMKEVYPLGIWGNAYDALNYIPRDAVAARTLAEFHAKLKKYLNDEYPPSWSMQGYLGVQFLVTAIKKAQSVNALKVSAALQGLELTTPFGPMTIRAKDHQLTRGMIWGRSAMSPQYPFPVLSPVEYIDPKILMD